MIKRSDDMSSAFSNYIYSANSSLDTNNNIVMDLDIGSLGIQRAIEQSDMPKDAVNLFNLKTLAENTNIKLITDGTAENIQMFLTYKGLGQYTVQLSDQDKNDLHIHSTVLLKQSPKQWINEQINKAHGKLNIVSSHDRFGEDTTVRDFYSQTRIFANATELAKDRTNSKKENSNYPFRHYNEQHPNLPPVDYTFTEVQNNVFTVKAEFNGHTYSLEFEKDKLQGQDIGKIIFNRAYGKTLEQEYFNEREKMCNYLEIQGLTYQYHGDYADPTVSYKGVTWSEWEISDAIEEYIKEDIDKGIVPEGTEIQDWISKEGNADVVKRFLDDWIAAQQTEDKIDELKKEANKKYSDELDAEFCADGWYDLSKWASKTDDNFDKLFKNFNISSEEAHKMASDYLEKWDNERLDDFVYDFLSEHTDSSDLIEIAKDCGIELEKPCMIYLQNGYSYDTVNMGECVRKLDKLNEEYSGLYVVVFNAEGTIYSNTLTETTGNDFRRENNMLLKPKEKQTNYEHTND